MATRVRFTKMHGAGNDYIYVDTALYTIAHPAETARRWSDRHKGIGSDGLVLIGRSPVPERLRVGEHSSGMADFTMRIFNADGSEAMMCGNASRCIGKYVYERGLVEPTQTTIRLLTLSGVKVITLKVSSSINKVESVTVDMLAPRLECADQYRPSPGDALPVGTFVSMGNPHYVVFTDDIKHLDLAREGERLEFHPAFPERCNIEFAQVVTPASADQPALIRTRVWERGSGITQACGTGACATAVAACLTGRAGRQSRILMDGGELDICWREDGDHVLLSGPAEFVFDGEAYAP